MTKPQRPDEQAPQGPPVSQDGPPLGACEEEENYKEKFYYLAAEMDNLRKRAEREKEEILKYGTKEILSELVKVLDNFERTLEAIGGDSDKKVQNIVTGIEMVQKQFVEALRSHGLSEVESVGRSFDPNVHEAVYYESSEGKKDLEIISELEKGYLLNGRLLRPAKVSVAKEEKKEKNHG